MKLSKRLLSLLLVCLLCFGLFSVGASAVESDFSDISDLTNWEVDPENSYPIEILYKYNTTYGYFYRYSVKSGFKVGDYAAVYNIPQLSTGSTYKFHFTLLHPSAGLPFFDNGTLSVGFGIKNGDGSITLCEESYITFTDPLVDLPDRFNDFEISFTYNGVGTPCIVILSVMHTDNPTNTDLALHFQNISFTQSSTETEKKLDGVLGFLDTIKNSLVDMQTDIRNFFNNIGSYFSNLGDRISGFFDTLLTNDDENTANIGQGLVDIWQRIVDKLTLVADGVESDIDNSWRQTVGKLETVKNQISTEITSSWQNIVGKLNDLKVNIVNSLVELGNNIINGIKNLFLPSDGYFDNLSDRFDLLIDNRFGALVTITDYLVEFFSSFDANQTKEFFDVPIININLLGYNFPIGGWRVRFVPDFNGVEILTNACKFISSTLATFAFFDGLKKKYSEVFGGVA